MTAPVPRALLLVLFSLLLVGPALAEEIGPNLLLDGGLETWKSTGPGEGGWDYLTVSLKNWSFSRTEAGRILTPAIFSQSAAAASVCRRAEGDTHGGKYALRFSGGMYLNPATPDAFRTAEGQEYLVRYWVKGAGDTTMYLTVYGKGGPAAEILSKQGRPDPARWTMIEERLRVVGQGATSIYPRLTASAPMLVDDLFVGRVIKDEDLPLVPVDPDTAARIALAPATTAPPTLDGRLDDPCWQNALRYGGMRRLSDEQVLAPAAAHFRVLHDDANLYFAVELPEPGADQIAAELKKKPPANPLDTYEGRHSVEIFLQPPGTAVYYQFVCSVDGVRYQGRGMDPSWKGTWEAAVSADEQGWVVEMRIPVTDFGLTRVAPGGVWRFNLTWNRETNYATWAEVGYDFHNPGAFGTLIMSDWPDWVQASETGWAQQAADLARRGPAVGLAVGERLALLQRAAAQVRATGATPKTWQDLTRAYSRMQFINNGYAALASEITYLTMFKQAGGKGQ